MEVDAFAPNLGRSKTDEFWDCIHVVRPDAEQTFCGHSLVEVAQACALDKSEPVHAGNGCWTCISLARKAGKVCNTSSPTEDEA